jgi:hypothetical protein
MKVSPLGIMCGLVFLSPVSSTSIKSTVQHLHLVSSGKIQYEAHEVLDPSNPRFGKKYVKVPPSVDKEDPYVRQSAYHHIDSTKYSLNPTPVVAHDVVRTNSGYGTSYGAGQKDLPKEDHIHPAVVSPHGSIASTQKSVRTVLVNDENARAEKSGRNWLRRVKVGQFERDLRKAGPHEASFYEPSIDPLV